jgi:tetratricopeptide (TPR) repeat protein
VLRPDRVGPHRSLGLALEALGRRDEAIDWYRRGLALAPGALSVRLSVASALLAAGRLDEVIQTVDAAWRFYEPAALVPYSRTLPGTDRRRLSRDSASCGPGSRLDSRTGRAWSTTCCAGSIPGWRG